MKSDLVIVEWGDAHSSALWEEVAEAIKAHKPSLCWSVGWVLERDKAGLTIYASVAGDSTISERTFVPSGMIKKITVLKKAGKGRTSSVN